MNARDIQESVTRARDAISVKRVFGEPYEKGGVTIIPAARVAGAGGGGVNGRGGGAPAAFGSGFGMVGRPAGVFVIKGDRVRWQPAVDPAVVAVAVAVLALRLRRGARRRRRASRPVTVEWTEAPAPVSDGRAEPAPALP